MTAPVEEAITAQVVEHTPKNRGGRPSYGAMTEHHLDDAFIKERYGFDIAAEEVRRPDGMPSFNAERRRRGADFLRTHYGQLYKAEKEHLDGEALLDYEPSLATDPHRTALMKVALLGLKKNAAWTTTFPLAFLDAVSDAHRNLDYRQVRQVFNTKYPLSDDRVAEENKRLGRHIQSALPNIRKGFSNAAGFLEGVTGESERQFVKDVLAENGGDVKAAGLVIQARKQRIEASRFMVQQMSDIFIALKGRDNEALPESSQLNDLAGEQGERATGLVEKMATDDKSAPDW